MTTTVAPAEEKTIPLPGHPSEATFTAVVAEGETGGGEFYLRVPGIEQTFTVADGTPWTLTFQNLGVVDAVVRNKGTTSLVFTTPDVP